MLQGFCTETSSLILSVIQKASLSNDFIIFNYHGRILFLFFSFTAPVYLWNLIFIFNSGNNIFHYFANNNNKKKHITMSKLETGTCTEQHHLENTCFWFELKQLWKSCNTHNKCVSAFTLMSGLHSLQTHLHAHPSCYTTGDPWPLYLLCTTVKTQNIGNSSCSGDGCSWSGTGRASSDSLGTSICSHLGYNSCWVANTV